MSSGSNALDMALDDVISQNKTDRRRPHSTRGGMRGGGGISKPHRGGFRSGNSNYSRQPYGSRPQRNGQQYNGNNNNSNNSYQQQQPRTSRNNLVVTNLHYNVTENDLYELFGQMGQLKRAFLHLGPSGGSAGVADIVFSNPHDAERALASYNNVELDGRPMRISFASQPVIAQQYSSGGGPTRRPMRNSNSQGSRSGRGGRGGNRRRQDTRPRPSEADLDADMDSYMATPNE
ncbi:hypothetical protein BJV82DRAFT_633870 [Fennellomyces sp. T-0311]|nr:hypothetical protein BJV82DRAFT_633870 [Fennellomyces sp. T-0311]